MEKHITKIENSDLYLLIVSINNPNPIISLIIGFKDELKTKGQKLLSNILKLKIALKFSDILLHLKTKKFIMAAEQKSQMKI